MSYNKGLVSVVIPTYRRKESVRRSVDSVLAQTYKYIEVLLVDDNEPDNEFSSYIRTLPEIIQDERFQVVTQERHINGAAARNAGIRKAHGEYIAFLDDDDYWLCNKIELQLAVLSDLSDEWGGIGCKNIALLLGNIVRATLPYKDGNICEAVLLRQADVSTDALLLRRSALDDAGYFDESLKRHQEVQLMTQFCYKFKLKLLNKYLVCVNVDDNQNRPNAEEFQRNKIEFLKSVSDIINKLPAIVQKRIAIMNRFELGCYKAKHGFQKGWFRDCFSIFHSFHTVFYANRTLFRRFISQRFAKKLVICDVNATMQLQEETI